MHSYDRFSKNRLLKMVYYGIFLNQLCLTSILIPILYTLHKVLNFPYFYQRCGRRTASISTNPFIPYVDHIKTHIISKNWLDNFGHIFLFAFMCFFGVKYRFFSLPVQDTASKIENSDAPSKVTYRI